jgi:hemerythrin-like domain-containing protein
MNERTRRGFLITTAAGAGVLVGCASSSGNHVASAAVPAAGDKKPKDDKAEDVTPPEDLMREHGLLNRILLAYEEIGRRIDGAQAFPPEALTSSANIVRRFVEDYHEKLEEQYLFPRFEKAGKLVDLVAVLRKQHDAGRRLTDQVQKFAASPSGDKKPLAQTLRLFIRMYRPHEAREDTVLFPAIRSVVSAKEFEDLGEVFEDKEHALFGQDGFENMVVEVAKIEQSLGIYDLAQFTP